jgi:hypothetical protein
MKKVNKETMTNRAQEAHAQREDKRSGSAGGRGSGSASGSRRAEERKQKKLMAKVTPATLAKEYGLSVNRIQAILRLKHEELQLVDKVYIANTTDTR